MLLLHISKICMRLMKFLYILQLASVKGQRSRARQGEAAGWGEKEWAMNRILDMNLRPGLFAEGSSYICC